MADSQVQSMGIGGPIVLAKYSMLEDPRMWVAMGMLAGVLLLAAAVFALLARWRKRQENLTFSAHDQLASFRLLYEQGELSQAEYDRVKKQLLGRLKGEVKPPAAEKPKPPPKPEQTTEGQPAPEPRSSDDSAS